MTKKRMSGHVIIMHTAATHGRMRFHIRVRIDERKEKERKGREINRKEKTGKKSRLCWERERKRERRRKNEEEGIIITFDTQEETCSGISFLSLSLSPSHPLSI